VVHQDEKDCKPAQQINSVQAVPVRSLSCRVRRGHPLIVHEKQICVIVQFPMETGGLLRIAAGNNAFLGNKQFSAARDELFC
jgi:hypothetical protein